MTKQTRRDFMVDGSMAVMGAGAGAMLTPAMLRAEENYPDSGEVKEGWDRKQMPTLVVIYLRGGADPLNTICPVGDDNYYNVRPKIAIPKKEKNGNPAALPFPEDFTIGGKKFKSYFGLNPKMASLMPLIEQGKVAPIVNVGSTHGTRSHFDAQDYMERAAPGIKTIQEGWLARYLRLTKKPYDKPLRGICARSLLPRSLRGRYPVLAGNNDAEQMKTFEELYAQSNMVNQTAREGAGVQKGSSLDNIPQGGGQGEMLKKKVLTQDAARDIITESGTNSAIRVKALKKALKKSTKTKYPGGSLGGQLRDIAKVIKSNVGLEVAAADYGGWDHHSNQGDVNGKMSRMLGYVADSMSAFYNDLGPRMDSVTVLVMSEFGRTVRENGNYGTDHGRGGFMLAMGNQINGNEIYGKWTGLSERALDYGRFMPVHTDFRMVFAETLHKMFDFDPFKHDFFPGWPRATSRPLNFHKKIQMG